MPLTDWKKYEPGDIVKIVQSTPQTMKLKKIEWKVVTSTTYAAELKPMAVRPDGKGFEHLKGYDTNRLEIVKSMKEQTLEKATPKISVDEAKNLPIAKWDQLTNGTEVVLAWSTGMGDHIQKGWEKYLGLRARMSWSAASYTTAQSVTLLDPNPDGSGTVSVYWMINALSLASEVAPKTEAGPKLLKIGDKVRVTIGSGLGWWHEGDICVVTKNQIQADDVVHIRRIDGTQGEDGKGKLAFFRKSLEILTDEEAAAVTVVKPVEKINVDEIYQYTGGAAKYEGLPVRVLQIKKLGTEVEYRVQPLRIRPTTMKAIQWAAWTTEAGNLTEWDGLLKKGDRVEFLLKSSKYGTWNKGEVVEVIEDAKHKSDNVHIQRGGSKHWFSPSDLRLTEKKLTFPAPEKSDLGLIDLETKLVDLETKTATTEIEVGDKVKILTGSYKDKTGIVGAVFEDLSLNVKIKGVAYNTSSKGTPFTHVSDVQLVPSFVDLDNHVPEVGAIVVISSSNGYEWLDKFIGLPCKVIELGTEDNGYGVKSVRLQPLRTRPGEAKGSAFEFMAFWWSDADKSTKPFDNTSVDSYQVGDVIELVGAGNGNLIGVISGIVPASTYPLSIQYVNTTKIDPVVTEYASVMPTEIRLSDKKLPNILKSKLDVILDGTEVAEKMVTETKKLDAPIWYTDLVSGPISVSVEGNPFTGSYNNGGFISKKAAAQLFTTTNAKVEDVSVSTVATPNTTDTAEAVKNKAALLEVATLMKDKTLPAVVRFEKIAKVMEKNGLM